jgi:hypothetical protein
MYFLASHKFGEYLEQKYKCDFNQVPMDSDIKDLFSYITPYINIDIYVKLLSYIDMIEFENFQRYFCISLKKYGNGELEEIDDIENIKDDVILQLLCIICLQYYFL